MTSEKSHEYKKEAEGFLSTHEFLKAGDRFSLSAYEGMGERKYSAFWTAESLRMLLMAGVCYWAGEEERRRKNRCEQGVLITEDLREYETRYDAEVGVMHEFEGDFKLIGGLGGWEKSYDNACETYSKCENPLGWNSDPPFSSNIKFLKDLARASGEEVDLGSSLWQEIINTSFTARIEYKRKNLQKLIKKIAEDGWQDVSTEG